MSLAMLNFTRQPGLMNTVRRQTELELGQKIQEAAIKESLKRLEKLSDLFKLAGENIIRAQDRQAKYFNSDVSFTISQRVLRRNCI